MEEPKLSLITSNHKYIAIDSNVLRSLVFLYEIKQKFVRVDFSQCRDPLISSYGLCLNRLLKMIENEELRLLIVSAVYQENKHIESVVEFIKKYCYFVKPALFTPEYVQEIKDLAQAYCKPYVKRGVQYPAPMQAKYDAYVDEDVPSNDCFIMAQSTVENCILLTANGKDFTFNPRTQKNSPGKKLNDRTMGIVDVNISQGYYVETENRILAPKAVHIGLFGTFVKKKHFDEFELTYPDENRITGSYKFI